MVMSRKKVPAESIGRGFDVPQADLLLLQKWACDETASGRLLGLLAAARENILETVIELVCLHSALQKGQNITAEIDESGTLVIGYDDSESTSQSSMMIDIARQLIVEDPEALNAIVTGTASPAIQSFIEADSEGSGRYLVDMSHYLLSGGEKARTIVSDILRKTGMADSVFPDESLPLPIRALAAVILQKQQETAS